MNLRFKVLLYIILTTSLIFITSVGFINLRYWNYSKTMSRQIADLYAKQTALAAQNILSSDLKIVMTLNDVFKSYSKFDYQTRTKFYNQMLMDILENNSDFLSVWVSWELSAIDPFWTKPYGRFRTMSFMSNGSIKIKNDSLNLDGDVPGSYYFLMKSGVEENLITDPYFFSYTQDTASSFLETSIGKGIFVGDKFVGAIGIDVSLVRFERIINELKPFEGSRIMIISNDGTIVAHDKPELVGKKISKVFPEYSSFKVNENIKKGMNFSFIIKDKTGINEYLSFYPIKLQGSSLPWSIGFVVSTDILVQDIKENTQLLLLISVFSLLLISFVIWGVLSIIVRPIEKVTKTLEALSKGLVLDGFKIYYDTKDEIGRMSKATNILIDSLKRTQQFSIEIGKGNLDIEYETLSSDDVLGKSLLEMRNNLRKAKVDESSRFNEAQKLSWTQNGITEVNEILRENSDNLDTLTKEIIKFLVKYTSSIQGGFYLLEKKDETDYIVLRAAYAYDRIKELKSDILIGEGLVGRVVKERKHVVIEDLPEGYLTVRSGLGDKSPDNLVIFPLLFEENVLGAIELAGFQKYDEFSVDFLIQIAIRITSSLSVLLKNLETANLLKESQLQTATFEMKEKQFMRQKQKLNEKQKEIEAKELQMQTAFIAIQTLGLYLELDLNKNIISTNEFLPRVFQVDKKEIVGKNVEDLTKLLKGTKIWIEKFWEDVIKGEIRKKTTTYYIGEKQVTVNDTYFKVKGVTSEKIIIIGM